MKPKFVVYITGLQNTNPLLGGGTAVTLSSAFSVCIGFFLISSWITIGILLPASVMNRLVSITK
jgi:hypothetical protein